MLKLENLHATVAGKPTLKRPDAYHPGERRMSLDVRPVTTSDAAELAGLLNAIIARGGTTALETPFTARL